MTSARDTEDEYIHDFQLNPEISNEAKKKNDTYLASRLDGELSATDEPTSNVSPESQPVRMTSLFKTNSGLSGIQINKRQRKEELLKKRSMSYDVRGNTFICGCCKKQDTSVLSITEPSTTPMFHLCTRCSSALNKKQDYAHTKNGTAEISEQNPNLVKFTCEKGHTWTVNIHRGYKNWCSSCIKLAKEEKKKMYKRQSSKINKDLADKQKKLFGEAMSQYLSSEEEGPTQNGNFDDLFVSILPIAKAKAEAFMGQPPSSKSCTLKQTMSVYKVLELDEARVRFILSGMNSNSIKVGYKKLALALHPDKNRHPLSKEAFQKASELFKSS
jgi:hypothetical protein